MSKSAIDEVAEEVYRTALQAPVISSRQVSGVASKSPERPQRTPFPIDFKEIDRFSYTEFAT